MECVICLSSTKIGEIASAKCGHCFHLSCIEHWLSGSRFCPSCRKPAEPSTLRKIYLEFDNTDTLNIDVDRLYDDIAERDQKICNLHKEKMELQTRLNLMQLDLDAERALRRQQQQGSQAQCQRNFSKFNTNPNKITQNLFLGTNGRSASSRASASQSAQVQSNNPPMQFVQYMTQPALVNNVHFTAPYPPFPVGRVRNCTRNSSNAQTVPNIPTQGHTNYSTIGAAMNFAANRTSAFQAPQPSSSTARVTNPFEDFSAQSIPNQSIRNDQAPINYSNQSSASVDQNTNRSTTHQISPYFFMNPNYPAIDQTQDQTLPLQNSMQPSQESGQNNAMNSGSNNAISNPAIDQTLHNLVNDYCFPNHMQHPYSAYRFH